MIKYRYLPNWDAKLCTPTITSPDPLQIFTNLQAILSQHAFAFADKSEFSRSLFQLIMKQYQDDHSLAGLFQLLKYTNQRRICPFIASQCYCIKVLTVSEPGEYHFNISPIYYLGPEYPDHHASRTGNILDQAAIIGLVRSTTNLNEPAQFNLGIDAGIAFEDALPSHNKKMSLSLSYSEKNLIANLTCEDHVTTQLLSWESFGVSNTAMSLNQDDAPPAFWAA